MEFDVFLSHNSKDKPIIEAIARELEDVHGLKCYLDKWNLIPGESWQDALEEALDGCKTIAIFVGSNQQINPWENEGMRSALVKRVQDKSPRVLPVLLPGAPHYRDVKLPIFLRRLIWVDFRSGLSDKTLHRLNSGITGKRPGTPAGDRKADSVKELRLGSDIRFPENELLTKEKSQIFLGELTAKRKDTAGELIELAGYLGHSPIAFELAGCYLQRHHSISVQNYLAQLETVLEDLSMKNWKADLKNASQHPLSLLQTFALSWKDIKNEKARKIFIMAGLLSHDTDIPLETFINALEITEVACDEYLDELVDLGLLHMLDENALAIHPLVAEFASRLDTENDNFQD